MPKRAVFQVYMGDKNPIYDLSVRSVGDYARRYGIDHIVVTSRKINFRAPHFEKFQILDFFEGDNAYEQILYLDADILVTPHAQNIFEGRDDVNVIYAFDENFDWPVMNRNITIDKMGELPFAWPANSRGRKQYFNTGVFILGKESQKCLRGFRTPPDVPNIWGYAEQNYINYLAVSNATPVVDVGYEFNRMHLGKKDPNNERRSAHFIHFAGPCSYGDAKLDKTQNFINEYVHFYGDGLI